MLRLILGLLKGAVIGGAVGYGAYAASLGGAFNWITYGLVGALVGLLVGRPIWRHLADRGSTIWTPLLKAIFGFGVAVGLYALAAKVWGGFEVQLDGGPVNVIDLPFALGGTIGAIYGAFVELDDADKKSAEAQDSASDDSASK